MAAPLEVFGNLDTDAEQEADKVKDEADISWMAAFKFLGKRLLERPFLIGITILLALVSAATSVLSLSLLFPFLETLQGGSGTLSGSSKLAFLVPYFQQFDAKTQVQIVAVGLFGLQLIKGTIQYLSSRLIAYQRVVFDLELRKDIFDQILDLEMRYINKEKVANLYTILRRFSSDSASAAKRMLKFFPRAASLIGYAVAMILVSWKLTIAALVLAAITFKTIDVIVDFVRRMSRKLNHLRVRLKHRALESLNALKVIHLFGREDHAREQYREDLRTYQQNKYQQSSAGAAVSPIYSTLMTGMVAGILVAGTFLLNTSTAVWVGILSVFMVVLFRLMGPTKKFASMKTTLAKRLPSVGKVQQFLERSNKPFLGDGDRPIETIDEGIEVEDVWFRYDEGDDWALRGIDIEVPKGSTVALVGSSGAGKSTLVDLIARLYDPTEGRVRVDGVDLREYKTLDWRRLLSVVSQDTFLFNESAMENIRYGRLDATDEEVRQAAKRANAHCFIEGFPEGYDTQLGERGVRLSGGQKQRIAIARAILADPELLLLDEATSSLDTETERQVQEALDDVSRDRTVLAIAHRLSTIQNADRIVVLEDGEVVEEGTHEGLMAREGHYHRYVQMQDLGTNGTSGDQPGAEDEQIYVVRGEDGWATARRNGTLLGEVRVLDGEAGPVADRGEDFLLVDGGDRGTVRIDGHVYEDVRIESGTETAQPSP